MSTCRSPDSASPLAQCSLQEFLDTLASSAMTPGAGAASGIALALAAACAGKAVAISRRHDDRSELASLQRHLAALQDSAVTLAEADAQLFRQHLESDDQRVAAQLRQTDRRMLEACHELNALLAANAHFIADNMRGDWHAARALSQASSVIQEGNLRELEAE